MDTTALAPWFGSNRMLAHHVADKLASCSWVGIPFGGGLSELAHIRASTIVVSDLHRQDDGTAKVRANGWKYYALDGRKSSNAKAPEILLVRN